ncbi:hypothetical protein A3F59_01970 [Candidatus Roizmanbacteria bacterium RIFCSPHIGHO2_12_FULL_38_13]|nr:MAG: hypothetical protein A2905_03860 [Candidatus Levybacteria bacterium RIFCSPLOWO2_01_FULL_36_10]OGK35686.1 MAG: hypothetical protein A3F59_01970 [Candidatus Roizmanbacteria bacterium RIFCSPHIGHO2_12_FULL_38_13]
MTKKTHYSIAEAAEFLGVHPETLRRWDRTKKLQAEKINERGDRRYNLEKLTNFKDIVRLGTDNKKEARIKIDESLATLEKIAEESKYSFSLGDHFRTSRDLAFFILEDKKMSDQFQALINVFSFEVYEDEFRPKMSGTDDSGEFWSFPNIKEFQQADIKFLRIFLTKYKHPKIISRIAHFLWMIEKDHKMAQLAVDQYLVVATKLKGLITNEPKNTPAFEISKALQSAYTIAKKVNYNVNKVNQSIADTILNFDNQSSSRWAITRRLIGLALTNKKEYGEDFWENTIKICKKMADEQEEKNNLFFARNFLELGEKIEKSVFKLDDKKWRQKIALSLEQEAEKHKESFVQSEFLVKAITEYRRLGDNAKVEELEKNLQESKQNMKFETFEKKMDISEWVAQIRTRFKTIVEKESKEQLLVRLTMDRSILPKYEEVKQQAEKNKKEYPISFLFSHVLVDESGDIPRKYDTELEKEYLSLLHQYYFSLMTSEPLVTVLFEELVEAEKLDLDAIQKYMIKCLWYGKEYDLRDTETKKVIFKSRKWIDILTPGIQAYLNALSMIKNKDIKGGRNSLILAVDSLSPKIEGIIREFYETIDKPVTKIKTERGGKQVTEKKGLDELLRESYASEIFGDDLLFLMKYVLMEISGYNLRNNVSHALMFRENYLLIYAHWLFIIILRLGAYQLSIKTQ